MHSPIAERRRHVFIDTHLHPALHGDGHSIGESLENFRALGGTLLSANASGGVGTKVLIEDHDHVFPVDSHGITCSQVMHVVLRRVTRRIDGFQGVVHLPVATEKFEPVDQYTEMQLVPTSEYDKDCYRAAFAVHRSPVFGEEQFAEFLGDGTNEQTHKTGV
jgi:hypothetical protein